MPLMDKLLVRKRAIIETINDQQQPSSDPRPPVRPPIVDRQVAAKANMVAKQNIQLCQALQAGWGGEAPS